MIVDVVLSEITKRLLRELSVLPSMSHFMNWNHVHTTPTYGMWQLYKILDKCS